VRDVPDDFHTQVGPRLEQLLASGETLDGQQAGLAALATWVRRNHPER